jgi:hypothetical protein
MTSSSDNRAERTVKDAVRVCRGLLLLDARDGRVDPGYYIYRSGLVYFHFHFYMRGLLG